MTDDAGVTENPRVSAGQAVRANAEQAERSNADRATPSPAERNPAPGWYYLILGDLAGTAVILVLLAPGIVGSLAVLALVISNSLLSALRRRISGDPPPAWSGRSLPYTIGGIVLCLGLFALGAWLVLGLGITWAAWAIGAAIFVLVAAGGWLAER